MRMFAIEYFTITTFSIINTGKSNQSNLKWITQVVINFHSNCFAQATRNGVFTMQYIYNTIYILTYIIQAQDQAVYYVFNFIYKYRGTFIIIC